MEIKPGLYRNWDGSVYKVHGVAIRNGEKVVVYSLNITKVQNGGYDVAKWTVPVKDFFQPTEYKGRLVPRFSKMD